MKIGMVFGNGIPQGGLNKANLLYARQLGVSDIILHLPDESTLPSTSLGYWTADDLIRVKNYVGSFDLNLAAIENFPVFHWNDILLDGPKKSKQIELLKKSVANLGKAGISSMGYYFSLAGVWGRKYGSYARGGALSDAFSKDNNAGLNSPLKESEVWGTGYPSADSERNIGIVEKEEMWRRLEYFLVNLVPVAEESNVRLAAHPDDPPIAVLRDTYRILTDPDDFDRLLNIYSSFYNGLEFCQGTISYMANGNIYDAIRKYSKNNNIVYVHLRNNSGRFPKYHETFLDDGDWDILKCLKLYKENGFEGVIAPDHTPEVNCGAPFHAGFAHSIGFLKAGLLLI